MSVEGTRTDGRWSMIEANGTRLILHYVVAAKTYTTYGIFPPGKRSGREVFLFVSYRVGFVDEREPEEMCTRNGVASGPRSLYSGSVRRWPPFDNVWTRPTSEFPLKSLPRIDRHRLDIQRRCGGKPLFHTARDDNGGRAGSGWTTLWHDARAGGKILSLGRSSPAINSIVLPITRYL